MQFGNCNKIIVEGETWYNYIVTNVLTNTIDINSSRYSKTGMLIQPAFNQAYLPTNSQIFKVPETDLLSIYCNDSHDGSDTLLTMAEKYDLKIGELRTVWDSTIEKPMKDKN